LKALWKAVSKMNLRELSRKLGVSQTTVSRALNGYPEVSEATRARIVAAAERYNYHPNIRAKSLATGRSMAIGHVIPLSAEHEMVNPVFGDFIAGAGEVYAREGYDMLLSVVRQQDEQKAYREMSSKRSVDGVIVHTPRLDDPRPALLNELGMPFVVHGRVPGLEEDYAWLDMDNRRAFRRATEFLLDLGHTRISLINGHETMDFARRRRTGFNEAFEGRGLCADAHLQSAGEMTESFGYHRAKELLARTDSPTAIFVSSILLAIGVQRAIGEAGLRMGKDISVVTHDDALSYLRNGDELPLFTATRSSVREAGMRCAEMLIERVKNPENALVQELWEAELILGQSTGRAPDSSF
jgi:LacI family transcriptional regulator